MMNEMFQGSFREIDNLNRSDVKNLALYNSYFATVYDEMCQAPNEAEIEFYYRYASLYGDSILELACGAGRISIPLAKKRFHITGVDLNQDMLDIFNRKLDRRYKRLKPYIELYQQDITELDLDKQFGLVILPATTIRLINQDLVEFLNSIYDYVKEDGCFIFDFLDNDFKENMMIVNEVNNMYFTDDEERLNVVWFQEHLNGKTKKSVVNFYASVFGEKIENYLGHTELNMHSYNEIEDIIEKSRFSDYSIEPHGENMFFCILKK